MPSSIRKIAVHTGLSIATVSMALRGVGRVAAATRQKILEASRTLGYTPSAAVSRAFSIARNPDSPRYRETLAFLTEFPMCSAPEFQSDLYNGAANRAEELGYKIEDFRLPYRAADHRRLSRILAGRGIRGVIILPRIKYHVTRLFLDWKRIAAVEIGHTIRNPLNLHRVERSLYYELSEAFHLLKKAGYRRIGLAIQPGEDSFRWGVYTAALLLYQQRVPERQRIPSMGQFGAWSKNTFRRWIKKHKPDVVIIHERHWVCDWLDEFEIRYPEDISVFSVNATDRELSGIRANRRGLSEAAVEMISLLLLRNELGLSNEPRCLQVRDAWQEGSSLKLPLSRL